MPASNRPAWIDAPVQGRLARIAPAAEPGTRSIGVTVEVANPRETMRAGQYALARVEIADPQPRLVVPVTAVVSAAGQDLVWTIEHGSLMRRGG
jgi:membrane fusion protein (multidrug efflux system)